MMPFGENEERNRIFNKYITQLNTENDNRTRAYALHGFMIMLFLTLGVLFEERWFLLAWPAYIFLVCKDGYFYSKKIAILIKNGAEEIYKFDAATTPSSSKNESENSNE